MGKLALPPTRARGRAAACRLIAALLTALSSTFAVAGADWEALLAQGVNLRRQGDLERSIEFLGEARRSAGSTLQAVAAAGELGVSLLQARRHGEAEALLEQAYAASSGHERARYALELGNLAAARKRPDDAAQHYRAAQADAAGDPAVELGAGLNLARLAPENERAARLAALFPALERVADPHIQARYSLNLGSQARGLGPAATALAFASLDRARHLLAGAAASRLQVETLDALAQLYEDRARDADALALNEQALAAAGTLPPALVADLRIGLEWRLGRIARRAGNADTALAAYQRAVDQVEAIRQDIPIEYDDGRSSYRATLEPIYLGLTELLLERADGAAAERGPAYLRRAAATIELIKQAELQDFLGDRCAVEVVEASAKAPPVGTAVLYAVLGSRRIELVLETAQGIVHRRVAAEVESVRGKALTLANALRNGHLDYRADSRQLYDWLLRPFEKIFAEQAIATLVVVPDGALRLVAFGALHDGERYAIEKLAISTVTGLSLTNTGAPRKRGFASLVGGVAEPGSVVEKLKRSELERILEPAAEGSRSPAAKIATRSLRRLRAPPAGTEATRQLEALRESLALPGVKDEVEAVGRLVPGTTLLNESFTVDRFQAQVTGGNYGIVHVASHGVFGGSADSSYILAYDDLLTMGGLQSLLKVEHFRRHPLELLTLSACDTAEGDERSPLGISGAALKARAKSVLGTLWPVEDGAARRVMERFYDGLVNRQLTKTEALRQAQLELIRNPELEHPFFWAPFTLIGNWL